MPPREQTSTPLILSLTAIALAILAGAVIAFSGSGGGDPATLQWTPPAPTLTPAPTATLTPAPTLPPTATTTPSATPTRVRPTATRAPSATPAPASDNAAPSTGATQTVASESDAPLARILQGPANLRSGPGSDFGVVMVANEGATFEATGQTGDGAWLRLCCVADAPAWVAGELVELPAGAALPVVE